MYDYQQPAQTNNNQIWQEKFIPIQGGFEKGSPIYICRTAYNNTHYIGKIVNDNCNFAMGAQEIYVKDFQVLFGKVH